jgi:hypothetical protein
MTNTITVRLRRPKSELQSKAKPNLNAWINDLIDRELGPRKADWNAVFERRKKGKPAFYCADEVRKASR